MKQKNTSPSKAKVKPKPKPGNAWYELVAKTWTDEKLRDALLKDPKTILKKNGIKVPKGLEIAIVQNTDDLFYMVLPEKPSDISDEDIEAIASSGTTLSHC